MFTFLIIVIILSCLHEFSHLFIILILFVEIHLLHIIHHITLPDLNRRKKAHVLICFQVLQEGLAAGPEQPPPPHPAITSQSTFAQSLVMMLPFLHF